jgi:transposase
MISKEQIAEIRRLFYVEHWKIGTIASQLGLHPDTVKGALQTERFNSWRPKPSQTDVYLDFIRQTLEQYPRLRATRLYQMLVERGYTGSVVQLRRVVRGLRPPVKEAFLRLATLVGEQAQADWASFGQVTIGGARRRLSCFVLTRSYSRTLWVEFFLDQSLENFLLGHVNAFNQWTGVPRIILYDNLKSVVLERRGEAIRFHPRILELCGHYHFAPRPCNVGRGNEKGRVERAIRYVRESFFAARSFTGIADLNRQARHWRETIADQRPWPQDDSRLVADAFEEERTRVIPLPAHPFSTDMVKTVRSEKTIYVRFDMNDYSIPYQAVGRPLTLIASPETVRLLDGASEIARHRRSYDRHQCVDDPAHIAELVERKRKALGATAVGRLGQAAPNIGAFLDAAFERGESIARQTAQLVALLDDYGASELQAAIAEALERHTPRASSVAFILARLHRSRGRRPLPVDMSRHPQLADLSISTHKLEIYDELSNDDEQD